MSIKAQQGAEDLIRSNVDEDQILRQRAEKSWLKYHLGNFPATQINGQTAVLMFRYPEVVQEINVSEDLESILAQIEANPPGYCVKFTLLQEVYEASVPSNVVGDPEYADFYRRGIEFRKRFLREEEVGILLHLIRCNQIQPEHTEMELATA